MKSPMKIVWVGLILGVLVSIAGYQDAGAQFFGDNVGIVSGAVEKADSQRGLTVRSSASASGEPMAYIPVGTEVRGEMSFRNGYVKLQTPYQGGWVRMDHLRPVGVEATVASVDRPDLCLRIRSEPSNGADKVGCAELGQKLALTGLWSTNNWAQVDQPTSGWVSASQIKSDLWPGIAATSGAKEEVIYRERPKKRVIYERDYYPWNYRYRGWDGGVNLHFKGKDKH
jgi:hypothetical protein